MSSVTKAILAVLSGSAIFTAAIRDGTSWSSTFGRAAGFSASEACKTCRKKSSRAGLSGFTSTRHAPASGSVFLSGG